MYVLLNKGLPVKILTESPYNGTWETNQYPGIVYDEIQDRWDWSDMPFETVQMLALRLTSMTGTSYIATRSMSSHPCHDIVAIPKVGDQVSYGFNGDYYPDGTIVKISKKLMITTSTGNTYRRVRDSGSWTQPGGTWGLVKGHISEKNPHF
jgi:hypothetical protein